MRVEASIVIDRSPDDVFAFLADVRQGSSTRWLRG
jgi:hypothetical protein